MRISEQVEDYILDTQNYDFGEILDMLVKDIKPIDKISLDECGIYWGDSQGDYLMCLEDYTREIFKKSCDMVINVIKSYE